jgi:hypothetical protein
VVRAKQAVFLLCLKLLEASSATAGNQEEQQTQPLRNEEKVKTDDWSDSEGKILVTIGRLVPTLATTQ